MEFVRCPEDGCDMLAFVAERYVLESTDGPIEHARLHCVCGHVLNCPVSKLERSDATSL